jgi:DNA repair exonuclease SbcCD nuclease subunit
MPLTHIFHLSDLHIRNGDNNYSRYEEYSQVFKETIVSINSNILELKLSFDDFIIVITGDIFHNKNVIGNYGLFIYREFVQALSNIGRLYIISGNHDYDQSDVNKPSLVYSSTFDIPNVFVLNISMSFIIDDIGFSFVSIDKTLDKYRNSGRIQDLPEFPIIPNPVKYKIALFHGSFASAKLYNGKSININK